MYKALLKETGQEILISEVPKRLEDRPEYKCPGCKMQVFASLNRGTNFTDRFSHNGDKECYDNCLHTAAINVLFEAIRFKILGGKKLVNFKADKLKVFKTALEKEYKPDVYLVTDGCSYAIEFTVTHPCEIDKIEYYCSEASSKFRALEIRLHIDDYKKFIKTRKSGKRYLTHEGMRKLKIAVLENMEGQEWIDGFAEKVEKLLPKEYITPMEESKIFPPSQSESFFSLLGRFIRKHWFILIAAALVVKIFSRRPKKEGAQNQKVKGIGVPKNRKPLKNQIEKRTSHKRKRR